MNSAIDEALFDGNFKANISQAGKNNGSSGSCETFSVFSPKCLLIMGKLQEDPCFNSEENFKRKVAIEKISNSETDIHQAGKNTGTF